MKEQLEVALDAPRKHAARRSITCCSSARPGSARRASRTSSARSSASASARSPGPALERKGDLAAILTSLEERDVLFIDEIHRLNARGRGDPLPGARGLPARHRRRPGPGGAHADARPAAVHARRRDDAHRPADDAAARPLRDDLPARLLRARRARDDRARARRGSSASRSRTRPPTRSRAARAARRGSRTGSCAACATSPRCATPGAITVEIADEALELLEVDEQGLERTDRELLAGDRRTSSAAGRSGSRRSPVALGEEPDTIEDVYEPYLLQLGFIQRTPRGRVVTELGLAHVGRAARRRASTACSEWRSSGFRDPRAPLDDLVERMHRRIEQLRAGRVRRSSERRRSSTRRSSRDGSGFARSADPADGAGLSASSTLVPHRRADGTETSSDPTPGRRRTAPRCGRSNGMPSPGGAERPPTAA